MKSAKTLSQVTPHVLRHTCITWLAQADVPFGAIARYAGHKSSRTTERVYAHHSPSYLLQVTRALDNPVRITAPKTAPTIASMLKKPGAGEGIRTLDPNLGKEETD